MGFITFVLNGKTWVTICAGLMLVLPVEFFRASADSATCKLPQRLVVIRGTVKINDPIVGETTGIGTLVFQRAGCDACYVGASIDPRGHYEIVVGDGQYTVMYMDPVEGKDYLAPEQARTIDTR